MKIVLIVLLSIFLHPIAMILMWIDLARRSDLGAVHKIVWFVVSIIWGLGPILYSIVGGSSLW